MDRAESRDAITSKKQGQKPTRFKMNRPLWLPTSRDAIPSKKKSKKTI